MHEVRRKNNENREHMDVFPKSFSAWSFITWYQPDWLALLVCEIPYSCVEDMFSVITELQRIVKKISMGYGNNDI